MSDQWLYRINGQEFGPVSLDLVRSLVTLGVIAPDDEVRDASRSNWILACAAAELRDSLKASEANLSVERREARDQWYCRGAAGDFGPLRLVDLIELAAQGELSPDEEVKSKLDDYWRQLHTIERLIELLPFKQDVEAKIQQSQARRQFETNRNHSSFDRWSATPTADVDGEEIHVIPFPGLRSTEITTAESAVDGERFDVESAIQTTPVETATIDELFDIDLTPTQSLSDSSECDEWMGWVQGTEFGPISYSELLTWAVTGRLSPLDFVRRGYEGQFVPAVNVPCLFTIRAASAARSVEQ